ncbi:MAG: ribonuclease Z [Deltaproteobacteria bacterium]|nr:MAG: ribonuclease Z [Deltaproteobacteria bacterium]
MKLLVLGVGDAFASKYYSTSLAVGFEDQWLLVDCPHPIRKMLREAGESSGVALEVGDFAALVLTHSHADHCSGVEGYLFFEHFVRGRKGPLAAHPEVHAALWPTHLAAGMSQLLHADGCVSRHEAADFIEPIALSESDSTRIGPFTVEIRRTIHHIPTFALRISAGGRSLGLSADTSYDEGLLDWLFEADRVVHETNYGVHTPYAALASLPEERRERMWLVHYPDDFDLDASAIEPLRQGQLYTV